MATVQNVCPLISFPVCSYVEVCSRGVEVRAPLDWDENDYAVVGESWLGRIYMEIIWVRKWRWFLQTMRASASE